MDLLFSHQVPSNSVQPGGLQNARLRCPLLSWSLPRFMSIELVVLSNHLILCLLQKDPYSFCLQSSTGSGSFPMCWLFVSGGQSIGASASALVLPMYIQGWFPLGLTGLILQSKGLSKSSPVPQLKPSILRRSAFFLVQLSHPYMTTGKTV